MRIYQVPADFSLNMFEIASYHQFFMTKANLYCNKRLELSDWDNKKFFEPFAQKIQRYKTIIIDEVQDFKEAWLYSIISYFLGEGGSVSVFGDGEQNIYGRDMEKETKMPPMRGMGFLGRWNEISERVSMRILNPQIAELASKFANNFVSDEMKPIVMQHNLFDDGFVIKYWNVGKANKAEKLVENINWITQTFKLEAKNVVVLAESISLLRELTFHYEIMNKRRAMINFETKQQYDELVKNVDNEYLKRDLENIRRAAKTHFTTCYDGIKLSTIHSFKGWESQSIILFLQTFNECDDDVDSYGIQERENTSSLIYTAITRARGNLFIINLGNDKYHDFFSSHIK